MLIFPIMTSILYIITYIVSVVKPQLCFIEQTKNHHSNKKYRAMSFGPCRPALLLNNISRTISRSLTRNRKTHDRPALFMHPTRPAPCLTQYISPPCFIQIVWVTRRVPQPVQDSGQNNPHYESLLVLEVPETSVNPTQSLIHKIIQRHTQLLAVILLYYII